MERIADEENESPNSVSDCSHSISPEARRIEMVFGIRSKTHCFLGGLD